MSPDESRTNVFPPNDADMHDYVVSHIDEAIEKGWVRPYFQPVVRTLTGKLCGTEALARWEDPTFGLLAPDQFIPALEETRLIYKLDCEMVRQICRQYRESVDEGVPVVPISFNLSRLDFDLCDIFGAIEEAVHEYEVPRGMLNIEITESVFGADPTFMASMVGKFHAVGYQVWMDDFGSGYSTLNALKDFEFDELKLDMEFLNRFGEKSKTILAAVVDMAKKLGIQTLAEGVETEEHRRYLRRIGCEKMQGYLFGKPMPYSHDNTVDLCDDIGVETRSERLYFEKIGGINTLSMSERDFVAGTSPEGYVTSMPLAIVEHFNGRFSILDSNRVFGESLEGIGVSSIEEAEERLNDETRAFARQARHLLETISRDKFARVDFVVGGVSCVVRAKHIVTQGGRVAVLVTIDDTIVQGEHARHDRMLESLSVLYTIYDHVDIIHLDEGFTEPVFSAVGWHVQYEAPSFEDTGRIFAEREIYPVDRERYIAFMDHASMVERIANSGEKFITGFFRARQKGGDYSWRLFALVHMADRPGNQVMLCIRSTHGENDALLQAMVDGPSEEFVASRAVDSALTDGNLWRALVRNESMCLFWKDRERRFAGANKAFLDYYGFNSLDDVLGKTDEDMGWHVDPIPFMEDEMRVLNEGEHIDGAMGQCIVRGIPRDIIATKRPVYQNGRIVGLVGYFVDADTQMERDSTVSSLPLRDPITGVLNFTGLESATWKYVDAYKRLGIDFAMISINVESFQRISDELGYEFGDKVLARVAEELRDIAGARCAIGHVFAERFVVLMQGATDEQLSEVCSDIERGLMSIVEIDGTPCTVYALAGFARYSILQDVEAMKRYNRNRRDERRDEVSGRLGSGDVITSSML